MLWPSRLQSPVEFFLTLCQTLPHLSGKDLGRGGKVDRTMQPPRVELVDIGGDLCVGILKVDEAVSAEAFRGVEFPHF